MSEEEVVPTMVYAPLGADGGYPADDYCYKVVGSDEVKACLKDGWFESPAKVPKKKAK